jgi:hypothetical protein
MPFEHRTADGHGIRTKRIEEPTYGAYYRGEPLDVSRIANTCLPIERRLAFEAIVQRCEIQHLLALCRTWVFAKYPDLVSDPHTRIVQATLSAPATQGEPHASLRAELFDERLDATI